MKKSLLTLALLSFASAGFAQNSAIYKVKDQLTKNDIAGAKATIEAALANPKTTKKAPFYNKAGELGLRALQPELIKASQGMPFDTTLFCTATDDAIVNYTKSFQENLLPNEKGKVKVDNNIQTDNHRRLLEMVSYYHYAAVFQHQNSNMSKAIEYFQKYLDYPSNPAFSKAESDSILTANKKDYAQTHFYLALINYKNKDWDATLSATEKILDDTLNLRDIYLMRMQAYLGKNDSTSYLNTLRDGAMRLQDPNFAQDLLREYMMRNQTAEAKAVAEEMVKNDPQSRMAWYMRGCVDLELTKDYPAARQSFKKAIELDPNFFEANMNMGATFVNEVVARRQKGEYCLDRTKVAKFNADFEKQKKFYAEARPYLEKAKELAPDKAKTWAYPLVVVYENLQLKAEANKMEKIYKEAIGAQ